MSNFNCTNSGMSSGLGAANQLRFITLCQNGSVQSASQNLNAQKTFMQTPAVQAAQNTTGPQYRHNLSQDTTNFLDKYAADDGKISTKDKAINFGKGVISPITTMFSSPKNFAIGAAGIIGSGLLIAATGGAIAPVMVAVGATGGAIGLIKGGLNAINAKTDEDAKKAWQGIGFGAGATLGAVAGSKAALKGAGINTEGLNPFSATIQCFKSVPGQVGKSVGAFTSGEAIVNIKDALHIKNKDAKKPDDKTDVKNTAEDKPIEELKKDLETEKPNGAEEVSKPNNEGEISIEEGGENILNGEENIEGLEGAEKPKKTQRPKRTPKARPRRQSRIKHKVPKKQAEKVKKEVKSISQILDDIVKNNDVDTQFKQTVESIKEIAQNPLEQPKYDEKGLIGAIRHLEGQADIKPDSSFDEAISYIENLLSKEYKIDRLQAKAGDTFDSKTISAFSTESTGDSKLENTVFKMLFSGFRRQTNGKIPSGWKIKVVKYVKQQE